MSELFGNKLVWVHLVLILNNLCNIVIFPFCISHSFYFYLFWFKDMLPCWLSCKTSTCWCRRCRFDPWVGKIPLRRKWQPTPVCLPKKFHREAWWATVYGVGKNWTWLSNLGKEMATHSSVLAWRIPGIGEPGGLPSLGSHRFGHDWSDLAAAEQLSTYAHTLWK